MSDPAHPVLFRRLRRGLNRARVRRLADRLARELAGGRAFTCLMTGDVELRRLNREFLGRDYPADVLAFPAAGGTGFQPAACLGDIAISVARAAAQARRYGHSLEDELGILMLHGLLHLLGFDHEVDSVRMRRAEARWRRALGLPASLTEREQA